MLSFVAAGQSVVNQTGSRFVQVHTVFFFLMTIKYPEEQRRSFQPCVYRGFMVMLCLNKSCSLGDFCKTDTLCKSN